MKKKPEMKVSYIYQEPKSEEEAKLAQAELQRAYDTLFEEVEKHIQSNKEG